MQNTPSSSPPPHNFPSPKGNTIYIHIIRSIWNAYILCPVRICKHEGTQKYLPRMHGRAGSAPPPSPAPSPEPWGGGGEPAGRVLPGILSREGGILACKLGGSHSRVYMASLYGRFIRQIYMATLYGGFIWRVKGAHLFKDGKQENIAKK